MAQVNITQKMVVSGTNALRLSGYNGHVKGQRRAVKIDHAGRSLELVLGDSTMVWGQHQTSAAQQESFQELREACSDGKVVDIEILD